MSNVLKANNFAVWTLQLSYIKLYIWFLDIIVNGMSHLFDFSWWHCVLLT